MKNLLKNCDNKNKETKEIIAKETKEIENNNNIIENVAKSEKITSGGRGEIENNRELQKYAPIIQYFWPKKTAV